MGPGPSAAMEAGSLTQGWASGTGTEGRCYQPCPCMPTAGPGSWLRPWPHGCWGSNLYLPPPPIPAPAPLAFLPAGSAPGLMQSIVPPRGPLRPSLEHRLRGRPAGDPTEQKRKLRLSEAARRVWWLPIVHPCTVPVARRPLWLPELRGHRRRDSQAGTLGTAGL